MAIRGGSCTRSVLLQALVEGLCVLSVSRDGFVERGGEGREEGGREREGRRRERRRAESRSEIHRRREEKEGREAKVEHHYRRVEGWIQIHERESGEGKRKREGKRRRGEKGEEKRAVQKEEKLRRQATTGWRAGQKDRSLTIDASCPSFCCHWRESWRQQPQ